MGLPFKDRDLVPFYESVDETAKIMSSRFRAQAADAARFVDELATSKQRLSPERFEKRLKKLVGEFDGDFSGSRTAARVQNKLRESMNIGADTFSDRAILRQVSGKGEAIEGFTHRMNFYADNYYERIVVPRLMKAYDPTKSPKAMRKELRQITRQLLKNNEAYWQNVANSSVSFSYHFGYLKAAELNNHTTLMYVAVLDERTTKFCRGIDGKTIKLSKVLDRLEEISEMTGDESSNYKYWKLASSVKGKPKITTMTKMGILVPPFHANCRTTLHAY